MEVFKVGDKVRISPSSSWYGEEDDQDPANPRDTTGIVESVSDDGSYILVMWPGEKYSNSYGPGDLILMTKPHKHAELAKKWFDDPSIEIEYSHPDFGGWELTSKPLWEEHLVYRIKPEPKPDIVIEKYAFYQDNTHPQVYTQSVFAGRDSNIRFIVDAETKQIKSVEMI